MHVCRDGRWAAKPKPRWEPSLRHRVSSVRWSSCRRNLQLLFLVALVYFLVHQLPAPPEWKNDTRADRPAPRYDVESRPRFLHHSRFRQDPDVEYEARLTHALQRIERDALAKDGNKYGSQDRIWQIMLRRDSSIINRNPDSVEFEEQNDDWEYSLVTHAWARDFITNTLSAVPDLLDLYNSYPSDVLRADLLRYLILWYHGGYYADMDVFPARPIRSCPSLAPLFDPVPSDSDNKPSALPNVSLVLGIEIDEPYASPKLMREWHWSRSYGFIQYTMYAPRRFSPLLRRAIVRVLAHTKRHNDESNFIRGPRYDEKTTLEVTGPGVFTDAILDVLSETLPLTHPLVKSSVAADAGIGGLVDSSGKIQKRVTWAPFHRLRKSIWVDASEGKDMGGLAVLPINVWGNGQRHSGSESFNNVHACINHRFGRTWKKGWWEYLFG